MDLSVAEQVLDEFIPSLEALEAQSGAILQFLKEKGLATDEQLAPYLEQARRASNVRWLAVRLRMNRLLTPAFMTGEETIEERPAERAQERAEEAGELPKEPSSGKEIKKEANKHLEKSAAGTKKDVAPANEKNSSKNNAPRERPEEDAA